MIYRNNVAVLAEKYHYFNANYPSLIVQTVTYPKYIIYCLVEVID